MVNIQIENIILKSRVTKRNATTREREGDDIISTEFDGKFCIISRVARNVIK